MSERKIRVMVSAPTKNLDVAVKSARPSLEDILQFAPQKVMEVGFDTLVEQVSSTYATVIDVIEALPKDDKLFKIKEISFTLGIDSSGQVSLFSVVSSGVTMQTGLTFTITRD